MKYDLVWKPLLKTIWQLLFNTMKIYNSDGIVFNSGSDYCSLLWINLIWTRKQLLIGSRQTPRFDFLNISLHQKLSIWSDVDNFWVQTFHGIRLESDCREEKVPGRPLVLSGMRGDGEAAGSGTALCPGAGPPVQSDVGTAAAEAPKVDPTSGPCSRGNVARAFRGWWNTFG